MNWPWRRRHEEDLERELRSHLELEAEEQREAGLDSEEARYAARRALGNSTLVKETVREVWGWTSVERIWQDVRSAVRAMLRKPGVAVTALVVLALGTGANTSIFSVVSTVLLRPLPYKDADRLVMVWESNRSRAFDTDQVSPLDFADWRSQSHVFEEMAASTDSMYTLTGSGEPTPIIGYQFSANYFHVLGVMPLVGRTFLPDEEQPGKNHVVVLGYRLWRSHFGEDSSIVGKTIRLDGAPYTVIGVMPKGVEYPKSTELWTPLIIPREAVNDRSYRFLRVIARLKNGIRIQQAQREMNSLAERLAREYPKTNKEEGATKIISVRETITGDIRPALLVLLCAVGFVLLIACANIANLLLVEAVARQKETAIRAALGASNSRLVRQFLTESLVLGFAGGLVGLFLAFLGTRALVAMFPPTISNLHIPRVEEIPIDGWVLAFAFALSLLTGVIFGLVPALQAAHVDTSESLKQSERGMAGGLAGRRLRNGLVAAEVALSLVLLAAAGLAMKSFANLVGGDLGFNPQSVLTMRLMLPPHKYQSEAAQLTLGEQVLDRIEALPGVKSAGTVTFLPLSGWWGTRGVTVVGQTASSQRVAVWSSVSRDYFRAMGIPLIEGRSFTDMDTHSSRAVAIISKTLARQLVPNQHAVGKRVNVDGLKSPVEIVGVTGDVHQLGMTSEIKGEIYLAFSQAPAPIICFAIRTESDPMQLARAAEGAVWAVDKDQAVSFVMSMQELASESLAPPRVIAILLGVFAAMALLMATVGIYGVISFSAAQRTHEIGVRVALGARSAEVLRLVAGQGMAAVAIGLAIGLAGSFALTRFLSSILFGVRPSDPLILAIVSIVLTGAALAASCFPARRAMKVDPMVALRYE